MGHPKARFLQPLRRRRSTLSGVAMGHDGRRRGRLSRLELKVGTAAAALFAEADGEPGGVADLLSRSWAPASAPVVRQDSTRHAPPSLVLRRDH